MKTLNDKIVALCIVIVGPFLVTASIEFLDWWLSAPIVLLVLIFWFGTMKQIGDYVNAEDDS